MSTQAKSRNLWLDLFKLFLVWQVVCIHFAKSLAENPYAPLYRMSVPMFFMLSGYFAYHTEQKTRQSKAISFAKRTLSYLLFGFVFYILFDFIVCFKDGGNPSSLFVSLYYNDFIRNFLFLNSNPIPNAYHLWFLIALFVVSLIHILITKFGKENWYFLIIPLCIAIHLFFNGYAKDYNGFVVSLVYTRNALFFGLPMFALGFSLAKFNLHKKPWLKFIYLALGVAFFFLQMQEGNVLEREVYISSILSAAFLLLFFVDLKTFDCSWYYHLFGKSMPFYIYIIHVAVGKRLEKHFVYTDFTLKCLAIFFLSLLIYEVVFLLIKLIEWLLKKAKEPQQVRVEPPQNEI